MRTHTYRTPNGAATAVLRSTTPRQAGSGSTPLLLPRRAGDTRITATRKHNRLRVYAMSDTREPRENDTTPVFCRAESCSAVVFLPFVEDHRGWQRLDLAAVEGWTFNTAAGWRCPTHVEGDAPRRSVSYASLKSAARATSGDSTSQQNRQTKSSSSLRCTAGTLTGDSRFRTASSHWQCIQFATTPLSHGGQGVRQTTRLLGRLSVRRCRGCADSSFHNAHLTLIGRLRYRVWSRR